MQKKKVPMRKCLGCGEQKEKRELVRIVRDKDGELHVDPGGKAAGRGAYLCRSSDCLKKAVKSKRIEKSLETPVGEELLRRLEEELSPDE